MKLKDLIKYDFVNAKTTISIHANNKVTNTEIKDPMILNFLDFEVEIFEHFKWGVLKVWLASPEDEGKNGN